MKSGKLKHRTKVIFVVIISLLFSSLIGTYLFDSSLQGSGSAMDSILLFVSIIIGFIGASLSVFATVSESKFANKLKSSPNSKKQFINTLKWTLLIGVVLVMLTILYQLLVVNIENEIILIIINYLWLFLIPLFIGMGYLIINVILKILFES
ncbi:hypothetical protein [Gracilibacillus lacisalsi]|uniref:hypothetical protein n=1 Tax=Gracilibacillus lacisalsi TaxID=393087 RepID=UPI000372B26F|nr:hypothetical protein [Gracilibacillus lacisalsi]